MRRIFKNNIYGRKERRRTNYLIPALLLLFVCALLLFLFPSPLASVGEFVGTPLWKGSERISNELSLAFGSILNSKKKLLEENDRLKKRIEVLEAEALLSSSRSSEYGELMDTLGRTIEEGQYILAYITSKPQKTPYDTFIVDRGSRDEVRVGDAIYSHEAIEVGTILSVEKTFSRGWLYSSPGQEFDVIFSNGVQATVTGRGGGMYVVELPKTTEIEVGEAVYNADRPDVLIGSVKAVDVQDELTFKKVYILSPFNIHEARSILIKI